MMRNDNKKFDTALIRDLAVLLDETNLSEIELEQGDTRIRVARQMTISAPVNVACTYGRTDSTGRSGFPGSSSAGRRTGPRRHDRNLANGRHGLSRRPNRAHRPSFRLATRWWKVRRS